VTDVVVHVAQARITAVRAALAAACRATGIAARVEQYATGSIFQRLQARRAPPPADIVVWFGPCAAHAAALDGLLQPYQPARRAPRAAHDPEWRWSASEFGMFAAAGLGTVQDLTGVVRLAVIDPERSEVGLMFLLATLDRARQVDGDVEQGWRWWQQRVDRGVSLHEDDVAAAAAVAAGRASRAVGLQTDGSGLLGLAPVPHAVALTAAARNVDAAQSLLDWLASEDAAGTGSLSAWAADRNGLAARLDAAPPLDVDWATRQYSATRQRWARSGFGPSSDAA
jgi:ABC-type Fe3+ transport system substrate-binding protein